MTENYKRLKAHILPLSAAKNFESACSEWVLECVEISDDFDHCPCGQEIKEHCYIRNKVTGHETYVGNVCVNRFLGMDTETLFEGLKRLKEDPCSNANHAVIDYAEERGFIFPKEIEFLRDTVRKRNLSARQKEWKAKISRRILEKTVVQRRTAR